MRKILAIIAMVVFGATGVSAKTITLEATMDNLYGSSALLSELGLTRGGSVKALITFDNDLSDGATTVSETRYTYDYLYSPYDSFELNAPSGTITAPSSDGSSHYVVSEDGIANVSGSISDFFRIYSNPNSNDPSSFRQLLVQSWDWDIAKWDRSTPLTADLLNSFSYDFFRFMQYRENGSSHSIASSSITWNEVDIAPVPLPASLPLFLIGLTGLGLVARRRRNNHI